jgi:hypothetical protein
LHILSWFLVLIMPDSKTSYICCIVLDSLPMQLLQKWLYFSSSSWSEALPGNEHVRFRL